MKYTSRIKPISYLKANAAKVVRGLAESGEPMIITQNGEATAETAQGAATEETSEQSASDAEPAEESPAPEHTSDNADEQDGEKPKH